MLNSSQLKALLSKGRGVSGIPEIAKAYQNDPRTQLATQAMANGSAVAPVAQGKYAYLDGIARVLQGAMGGAMDRSQQAKYGDRTDAAMGAQRTAALASMSDGSETPDPMAPPVAPPPMAQPAPQAGPPVHDQIAAAVSGQPVPSPASGPPPGPGMAIPTAPIPQGGPPGGRNPFPVSPPVGGPFDLSKGAAILKASGARMTSGFRTPEKNASVHGVANSQHMDGTPENPQAMDWVPVKGESIAQLQKRARAAFPGFDVIAETNHVHIEPSKAMVAARGAAKTAEVATSTIDPFAQPTPEPVPEALAPMQRPAAPVVVAATKSPLLKAAYQLMLNGTQDTYGNAQRMYESGLKEQGDDNEAEAGRKQAIANAGYSTELGMYSHSQEAAEAAKRAERAGVVLNNQKDLDSWIAWERSMKKDEADNAAKIAAAGARTSSNAWGLTEEEQAALNKASGENRIDASRLNSRTGKIMAGILMANPGFDAMSNHGMAALIGNAPAQQKAMMAGMLPEVLGNVRDAGKKLNYSDVAFVGKLQSWVNGQLNDPNLTAYMTQRNDAMQTLANVMSGVGATDLRTKMESEAAPKSMSPKAWDAWYEGQLKALQPRIDMYERKRLIGASDVPKPAAAAPASGWGKATVVH